MKYIIAAFLALAFLAAGKAQSQEARAYMQARQIICMPETKLVSELGRLGETLLMEGYRYKTDHEMRVSVYYNPEKKTFSVVETVSGQSCMITAGNTAGPGRVQPDGPSL